MTTTATYTPNVLCSTAGMSEQEWLGWRTKGIGGSDAGTVLGANPYKTKRELYYEKRGIQPVKEVFSLSKQRMRTHFHSAGERRLNRP